MTVSTVVSLFSGNESDYFLIVVEFVLGVVANESIWAKKNDIKIYFLFFIFLLF